MADGAFHLAGVSVYDGGRRLAERPLCWKRAKEFALRRTEGGLSQLRRSKEQALKYKRQRAQLLREYATMGDAVKIRMLGYDYVLNEDCLKEATKSQQERIVFAANDFPYCFEDGVEHHVIWSEMELDNAAVESVIRENRQGYETVWFRNPPPLQTIPELWHVHVLSYPLSKEARPEA